MSAYVYARGDTGRKVAHATNAKDGRGIFGGDGRSVMGGRGRVLVGAHLELGRINRVVRRRDGV